jgi:hypothetical protein
MDPAATQATSPLSFSWLPESLRDPNLFLIVGVCWAAGFMARGASFVSPDGRQLVVLVIGLCFGVDLIKPTMRGLGLGLIYSALSMISYDMVISRIEDFFSNKIAVYKMNQAMKNTSILVFLLTALSLVISGCAGMPSQFANEAPPLSTNDQNIVIACATARQDMPEIEIGIETATPFALTAACKQPATLTRVGGFVHLTGLGMEALGGQGSISPTAITDAAGMLNTSIDDASLLQGILNSASSAYAGIRTHIETLADAAQNPDVKAYAIGTIPIVIGDVGTALVYSTNQYGGTSNPTTVTAVSRYKRARLHAEAVLLYAKLYPDDLRRMIVSYSRD